MTARQYALPFLACAIVMLLPAVAFPDIYSSKSPRSAPCKFPRMAKDEYYPDVRARILAQGYVPDPPADTSFCNTGIVDCIKVPEIDDCSVNGWCSANFRDKAGDKLHVVSYGDGYPDTRVLKGWDIVCAIKPGKR